MKIQKNRTFIFKPESGAEGVGIFLAQNFKSIPAHAFGEKRAYIAQEYLADPYVLDEKKFDLRIYVLVLSLDPLTAFIADEGMVRFCTENY
jgi:glutathione synthase/RimK-type ligase-like ATP-grasp enzyme